MIYGVVKLKGVEDPVAFIFENKGVLDYALKQKDTEWIDYIIPFRISGRTYQERKASLRDIAICYSNANCGGLSWGEVALIGDFFRTNGKRYGLLREFSENGIC